MPYELFTLDHFAAYTRNLVLDTGDYWDLEDFQAEIAESVLDPIRRLLSGERQTQAEVWIVIPEGNAKTTLMAGLGLYVADFAPLPCIPVGASTRDQAEILAHQAYQMIRMSPGMLKRFHIYAGYRRIQPIRKDHPEPGQRGIVITAADQATGDGMIPSPMSICDEGHRHRDMQLYQLWTGKLIKRGGVSVMISTAGVPGHGFETLRDEIRRKAAEGGTQERHGAHVVSRSPGGRVTMHEWQVQDQRWASDMSKVKAANPLAAITETQLQEQFDSPTTNRGLWLRLKCNIPARATNAAVSAAEFDDRKEDATIPPGFHIGIGIDVAWLHDTFAIVPQAKLSKYRLYGKPTILQPPRDGTMLHPDFVKTALSEFLETYVVDVAVLDVSRAEEIAAWLEDQGVQVVLWPQGNAQAARDYEGFMSDLRTGAIRHTGDEAFRQHVLNAVARPLPGDKWRFDRPTSSRSRTHDDERVIDALAAATFINSYHRDVPDIDVDDFRVSLLG